jgi:hypothetical protein
MADLTIADTRVVRDHGNEYTVEVDVKNEGDATAGGLLEFEYSGERLSQQYTNIEGGRTGTVRARVPEPAAANSETPNVAITYSGEVLGSVELKATTPPDEKYATREEVEALRGEVDGLENAVAELRAELDEVEDEANQDVPDGGSADNGLGETVEEGVSVARRILNAFSK